MQDFIPWSHEQMWQVFPCSIPEIKSFTNICLFSDSLELTSHFLQDVYICITILCCLEIYYLNQQNINTKVQVKYVYTHRGKHTHTHICKLAKFKFIVVRHFQGVCLRFLWMRCQNYKGLSEGKRGVVGVGDMIHMMPWRHTKHVKQATEVISNGKKKKKYWQRVTKVQSCTCSLRKPCDLWIIWDDSRHLPMNILYRIMYWKWIERNNMAILKHTMACGSAQ